MSVPTVNTSTWCLPAKNQRGDGRIRDEAYAKVGLPTGPGPAKPRDAEPQTEAVASAGGLMGALDTSDWRLPSRQDAPIEEMKAIEWDLKAILRKADANYLTADQVAAQLKRVGYEGAYLAKALKMLPQLPGVEIIRKGKPDERYSLKRYKEQTESRADVLLSPRKKKSPLVRRKGKPVLFGGESKTEESVFDKPEWVADFKAGWEASKKAPKYVVPKTAYRRGNTSKKHGSSWIDGYGAWIDYKRGATKQSGVQDAKKMGLIESRSGSRLHDMTVFNADLWKMIKSSIGEDMGGVTPRLSFRRGYRRKVELGEQSVWLEDGYARIGETRIHYGSKTLQAIYREIADALEAETRMDEAMKHGTVVKVKYGNPDLPEATFKVVRTYPTKGDADGPFPRDLLRLIKKGGGAVLLKAGKGAGAPGHYFMALDASGKRDGFPVWLKPAQYKRAMSYEYSEGIEEARGVTVKNLSPDESQAAKSQYRHNRGRVGAGPTKVGRRVKYKGHDWLILDVQADSAVKGGATVVLVSRDFQKVAQWVDPADLTEGVSGLSDEIRQLAGIAPKNGLPHVVHDADNIRHHVGAGILDERSNRPVEGEEYIDRVLRESRWFLKQHSSLGVFDPLGEAPGGAPGGRAGPWRGGVDSPDEVSLDDLETDDVEFDWDEPEDEIDEPEDEMGERAGGAGSRVGHKVGGLMKRLGGKLARGTASSRAGKEKIKSALGRSLEKFKAKHGIGDAPAPKKKRGAPKKS